MDGDKGLSEPSTSLSWESIAVCSRSCRPYFRVSSTDRSKLPPNAVLLLKKQCPMCNEVLHVPPHQNSKAFLNHLKTHYGTLNHRSKLPCPECFEFIDEKTIKVHIEKNHPGAKSTIYDEPYRVVDYTNAVVTYEAAEIESSNKKKEESSRGKRRSTRIREKEEANEETEEKLEPKPRKKKR